MLVIGQLPQLRVSLRSTRSINEIRSPAYILGESESARDKEVADPKRCARENCAMLLPRNSNRELIIDWKMGKRAQHECPDENLSCGDPLDTPSYIRTGNAACVQTRRLLQCVKARRVITARSLYTSTKRQGVAV